MDFLSLVDPGLATEGVVSLELSVRGSAHAEPEARAAYYAQVLERVRALPGVQEAGLVNHLPLAGDIWGNSYTVEGVAPLPEGESLGAVYRVATPAYFAAAGLQFVEGGVQGVEDRPDTEPVVVVNDRLARLHWPDATAVGQRLLLGQDAEGNPVARRIVGVVRAPVQADWSGEREPETYRLLSQDANFSAGMGGPFAMMTLVVRTAGDPRPLLPELRTTVQALDPAVALSNLQTMADVVGRATAGPRFNVLLVGLFAVVALALGAVGVYGLIGYIVAGRRAEIAVRMALGARPGDVTRMVLRENLGILAGGLAVGLVGALAAGRLLQGLLFGVGTADPLAYAAATVTLVISAVVASVVPARRAARTDPSAALRGG